VSPGDPKPTLDIAGIADAPAGPNEPDSETRKEEEDLDRQERQARITGVLQDINERKKYAGRIFCLVSLWLIGIFLLLLLDGFLSPINVFHLANSVLIAAIGGTTLNVIGIFIVVARYLFARRPDESPTRERRLRRYADFRG
jgi:hypothetical protein